MKRTNRIPQKNNSSQKDGTLQTKRLEFVWFWADEYTRLYEKAALSRNMNKLFNLREEIKDFNGEIERGWMGYRFVKLRIENQQKLLTINNKLYELDLKIGQSLLLLQRDERLLKHMERIELTEENPKSTSRDLSSWVHGALVYPASLTENLLKE